ncbi:hypothetical protein E5F05_10070 [Deinococcus metallilatus]|uniref:DUF2946 domain-containing protein n=1 Tax=Deinococcus metallilatus TaxID=1211322 RepID=A0AAJ5F2B4_9DEIO|nr:hypothetical protein [Deinococcus metallilatus]MBB5295910.1 hypothetical protein [Deinococcus metallilatus]QBY08256.1 hypothetical protein E5F05_10070 [Deinococcus metallilatus]RXJ11987.1 hypothetical protein ERJ73_08880 [Deinococcus metallilatus]TLK25781.1 hypothetical protein FCS05_12100 [Deinococcus metallilatus]GMA14556.1 hypothetical protein GCM10025871_08870 [Deinococcus metallilatus]
MSHHNVARMREDAGVPVLRLLLPLLAALLLLVEAPLHALHTLDMSLAQMPPSMSVHRDSAAGMAMTAGDHHHHHPAPAPPRTLPHVQDHSCCMPPAVTLAPTLELPPVTVWRPHPLTPTAVHAQRLAVLQRARGPPFSWLAA